MYWSNIQTLTTIIAFTILFSDAGAQTPILTFSFDEGLEDWTPVGLASSDPTKADSALWVWSPNGDAGSGAFNMGNVPISSISGGGALLFDSDGYDNGGDPDPSAAGTGPVPAPQKGEITSPPLDFSGETRVVLAFYQYYRYFAKDTDPANIDQDTPNSSFEVSGDGGTTWTSFVINEVICPNESTDLPT